jgi:hypothetical protein
MNKKILSMLVLAIVIDGGLSIFYTKFQKFEVCMQEDGQIYASEVCPLLPETTEQWAIKIVGIIFTLVLAILTYFSVKEDRRRFKRVY